MNTLFYGAAAISTVAGILVITRKNAMHALIYLVLVLLAIAAMLFALGATFVAALQIIIYAGAIMVLFVFAVMMLNLGPIQEQREREWMAGSIWIVPLILTAALFWLVLRAVVSPTGMSAPLQHAVPVSPQEVGVSLYQKYVLGVELASMLLLAGLVSAFHFGLLLRERERTDDDHSD